MRRLATLCLVSLAGCTVDFQSTPTTNPGVSTAPAEVVALAGPDLVVLEGSRVVLAGGASRALVGAAELAWSQREGPLVTLSNPASPAPAFVAPLAPARLVFTLEVSADDVRDVDEVVVDVVAADLPASPRVVTLPADRGVALDELVRLEAPWTGAGSPRVSVRCPTLSAEPLGRLEGQTLVIEFSPRALPCPVVVEDDVTTGAAAGRAATTLWPADDAPATTTRVRAPATVDPGAPVSIDLDEGGNLFVVDGTALSFEREGDRVGFAAPTRPGRLTLLAETRVDGRSGGLRVVAIEVGAGVGNSAPVVDGGPDLRVRPGARFRIAPVASDDDGDPIEVSVTQVLGLLARQAGGGVGVLVAPDEVTPQTLLFHVVAHDGVADSAIDPVRVSVDPTAENLPPVIALDPELYVTPGSTFVIDGSDATDPDAGLIAGWRIAQARTDATILLDTAVDAPTVSLTAGAAGERYRFVVSVIDDGGLEASAEVTVIVEDAGPFVDPARASAGADGTVARPFASVPDALLTAARHRFPALHLVGGATALNLVAMPDGLGLVGGWRFDDDAGAYVKDAPATVVRLAEGELRFAGGDLEGLDLRTDRSSALRLQRRVSLVGITIADGIATRVDAGARVVVRGSSLGPLESSGSLDAQDSALRGGLRLVDAVTDLGDGVRVEAGAFDEAVDISGGVLRLAGTGVIVGGPVGLRVGPGAVVAIGGAIEAGDDDEAIAMVVEGGTAELGDARFAVTAPAATGLLIGSGTVGGRFDLEVDGDDVIGVHARSAPGATLGGSWTLTGVTRAVGVEAPDLALDRTRLLVSAADAVGIRADAVTLQATLVAADGASAIDIVADRGSLRHVSLLGGGRGLDATGTVTFDNGLCLAPDGVVGPVVFGVVGFVEGVDPTGFGCTGCVTGPAAAVLPAGDLSSDDALGSENPFVDRGDPARAVPLDLAGVAIPQGAGPDLGALERPAP